MPRFTMLGVVLGSKAAAAFEAFSLLAAPPFLRLLEKSMLIFVETGVQLVIY